MKSINLEQKNTNKRSGRKCANYEKLEADYQLAQTNWDKNGDKASWDKMFTLINLAVFNNINKKLEHILEREEIEGRALDITLNIMQGLLNKKAKGKDWKIQRVSAYVHLPCLAIYSKRLQFADQILGEDSYTALDEEGNKTVIEFEDSYLESGTGIYHLHGGEDR